MGIISEKLGNLRHAAVAYSRAEKIFKRIGASRSQAYAAANLGTNLTKRAWLAEALAKLWEAHGVFEQIGDRRSAAYAEGDLACIYQMLGEYERAQALFTQAIEKGEDLGEGEFVLENKIRLAEMHLWQSGQLSGEKLVELQNQAEEVGSPELKMKSFLLQATRSVLNRDLSGLEKALSAIRAFSELTDFPEIHLQTTAFLAIDDWDHGRISRAKKGLLAALRKALRKDFATTAMGMWIFACGVGLAHGLPQELHAHVTGLLERACAGFDPNQRAAIQAEMRRRIARIAAGPATVTAQTQLIKV